MKDFNLRELGVLHMMITSALEDSDELNAPLEVIKVLEQIVEKLEPLIEEQCNIFNEFQSIASNLDDLDLSSKILIKNPNAEIPEYH
jgi:hypothetical protein